MSLFFSRQAEPYMSQILLMLFTLLLSESSGQAPPSAGWGGTLKFQRLSIEDGMSQSTIRDIVQDEAGFLWFATIDGLNRYDGYRFKIYRGDVNDDTTLSSSALRALAPAGGDWMWVGTGDGLDLFDTRTEAVQHFRHDPSDPTSLGENRVTVLLVDDHDRLWVGTETGGLNLMDQETGGFTHFYFPVAGEVEASSDIQDVVQDRAGNIWVCTEDAGLWQAEPAAGDAFQFKPVLQAPGLAVKTLFEDADGRIWVGTTAGFGELKNGELQRLLLPFERPEEPPAAVLEVYQDQDRVLWLGTSGQGLVRYYPSGRFEHDRHDSGDARSLSEDTIQCIYRDRSGLLWLGAFLGLNKLDPDHALFSMVPGGSGRRGGLMGAYVLDILEDSQKTLWVGTERALNRFDRQSGKTTYYKHNPLQEDSLGNGRVRSVYEDRKGVMWVGTEGGGLHKMAGDRFIHFRNDPDNPNSLVDDEIRILAGDRDGSLWIGCNNGLSRLSADRTQFQNFRRIPGRNDSLTYNFILDIVPDGDHGVWIATSRGLNLFNRQTGSFRRFLRDPGNPTSLSDNGVSTVYKDAGGLLWVGTLGGGLNRLDPGRESAGFFKRYTIRDGLANDTVYGILGDDRGNLWVSTNMGLSRFNPTDERFRNFTVEDGLQSNEFNTGAYFKSKSGELFFGGINGFNSFYPDQIRRSSYRPKIELTSLEVFGRGGLATFPSATTRQVVMSPDDFFVSVEFAALDLTAPRRNRYAYRLEGLHEQWIELNRNELVLSKPEYGRYTLRVKGSNHDGVWSEGEARLELLAPTPPWRTPWAYLAYALVIAVVIAVGYRLRLKAVLARERELEELVEQRTGELLDTRQELLDAAHRAGMAEVATNVLHEIGNTLNSINISADLMEEALQKDNPVRLLQRIGEVLGQPSEAGMSNREQIAGTLNKITHRLRNDRGKLGSEMTRLRKDLNTIIRIIRDQHQHTHFAEHIEVLDVGGMIRTVIAGMRGDLVNDGIHLVERLSTTRAVKVNKNKLMRVLVNLIGNAGDAVRSGVGERRIEIVARMRGEDEVLIEVVDNGMGIPADLMTKIFTHGYTTKRSGNGFGLHFCANAVSEMGGKLTAASDGPGQGARFTITLPIDRPTADPPQEP